ncbi:MAG: RDD family protein [Chitinophagaceae bacterium]
MIISNKYKTFGQRILAGIIDGLVFLPVYIIGEIFPDKDNKWVFVGLNLFSNFSWILYYVIGHGKFGQTVGKKVMKIKVFSIDEKELIGYKRAFLRESIWFFINLALIASLIFNRDITYLSEETNIHYGKYALIISSSLVLIEIIIMFSNPKRRALHDFLGGSVVIDLKEAEKEKLSKIIN